MAIDPVCGMTVDEATEIRAERDGSDFYFCSERCRKKFPASEPNAEQVHQRHPDATVAEPAQPDDYICPMHPEVRSHRPGSCPKCDMALERSRPAAARAEVIYTCPMHPEIEQDHPATVRNAGWPWNPNPFSLTESKTIRNCGI